MAVALKLQTLKLPPDQRRRLDELRAAIRAEERAVEASQGSERAAALDKLVALRRELLGLIKDAESGTTKLGSALTLARRVVPKGGAMAMPILTKVGSKLLIITTGKDGALPVVVDLPDLTTDRMEQLLRGDQQADKPSGWFAAYTINYMPPAQQDVRWPEWLAAIDRLGPKLWRLFAGRLDAVLKERGIKPGARLIWLPSGALGILPLGLAQDPASKPSGQKPEGGRRLADTYEIVYAPSLEALAAAKERIATASPASLAAIINPTEDLPATEKEGALVAAHFPGTAKTLVARSNATPETVLAALKGRSHWHFASHGTFNWDDARQSALLMHNKALLTVGRLLETDGLGTPRLVVLSACETGLYEIGPTADEFIGLPGAFMALGAAGVLGTLWPVSDDATALLVAKFYDLHQGEGSVRRLP